MLEQIKLALRIKTDAFNSELETLISAAQKDLGIAGVENLPQDDALIIRAIVTYVKMNFGEPANYDRLKASYDEQKAQLSMSSEYNQKEVSNDAK